MDFIITSLQSWDIEIGSTIKNVALEMSKQHRVFYISTPYSLKHWFSNSQKRPDKQVNDNLKVVYCNSPALPVNSLPFTWMFDVVNYFNNYIISLTIKRVIKKYNIGKYIHFVDTDLYRSRYLKQLLKPDISIYYRRDYVIGFDYWRKYGPACEQALARQADIVITNSSYFTEELKPYNPNIFTTNTGVKLDLYDASVQHPCPADIEHIASPRIGYTGALIETRLNVELIYSVVKRLPQYNFVFVGPEDEYFAQHPLHDLPNAFFTGHKEVEQLSAYIQHFDVCLNPQKANPITEGNYPLKIDEYLALGKPIVATSTHTMRDVFAGHTHLATDVDSYIKAIEAALSEKDDENLKKERIAFAHTHSWGHCVEDIYKIINNYTKCCKNNKNKISL